MFRLLRYFVISSFVAFAVTVATLFALYRHHALSDLVALEEAKNTALSRAVANAVEGELGEYLALASRLGNEELQRVPEMHALRALMLAHMEGQSIVKIKVYSLDGRVVFSTETSQIGDDQSDNAGFITASKGGVASQLTHRDSFNAFDGLIEDRDVISSYIPLYGQSAENSIDGAFEIYSDVTPLLARIDRTQITLLAIVSSILGLLYLFLLVVVRRADAIIRDQATDLQVARNMAEQANAAKSEFVSFVAHELNAPITVMKMHADLLQRGVKGVLNEGQAKYVDVIQHNVDRMRALAADLADVSRLETGTFSMELDNVAMQDLLRDVTVSFRRLAEEKGVELTLDLAEDLPAAHADSQRLQQVVTNLVSNACKYTPPGGRITVAARRAGEAQEMIETIVQDTGIGIAPDEQSSIFQRFFRSRDDEALRNHGTGLGLYITRKLVELQGGRIWFESQFREGTTFYFTVPATRP